MINWKAAAKFWYSQFLLWEKAYNQLADVYMIDESFSAGSPCQTVTHLTWCAGDTAMPSDSQAHGDNPLVCAKNAHTSKPTRIT